MFSELLMEPCNKVSIVIGGTTGIGLAIANELLLNNVKVSRFSYH